MKLLFLLLLCPALSAQQHPPTPPCAECAAWNAPQKPFRIYGNTYYVGPHGLSSILLTSDAGHILMDGALPESVPQIVDHIQSLGFRIQDVKLIVNSHVHFDHAGGIAGLQRLSGARVVASKWSADVMTKTGISPEDPQYGILQPIALVPHVDTLTDGQSFSVGSLTVTAHLTPGHTPGGTSWTWKSCQDGRCLDMVYADSLTPVSAAGYQFTKHPAALDSFQKSFAFLSAVPCDVLLTTHPDVSSLWARLDAHQFVDPAACKHLADHVRDQLTKRVTSERGQ
jgi:metallo-beta-lactamase class B